MCPVLAAMYSAGKLQTNEEGRVSLTELFRMLTQDLGVGANFAAFQARGVAAYKLDDKDETTRSRKVFEDGEERFLNIFRMHKNPDVRHGMGTAIRAESGVSEKLFEEFITNNTVNPDRMYRSDILNIVEYTERFGDHEGEFSESMFQTLREWQMRLAMDGFLAAFGEQDENGEPYLKMSDVHKLYIDGQLPENWQKRDWGCLLYGCEMPAYQSVLGAWSQL
jgi:hypothetical protein